jgi:hypothetical protein
MPRSASKTAFSTPNPRCHPRRREHRILLGSRVDKEARIDCQPPEGANEGVVYQVNLVPASRPAQRHILRCLGNGDDAPKNLAPAECLS